MKIGIGYDIHRLVAGRPMVIGGVRIPCEKGPFGHSDGDVLIHAVCDAILGALGKGDIGKLFPDTDAAYKDMDSRKFLEDVSRIMSAEGFAVGNIDCVVITQSPRIADYRCRIEDSISVILGIPCGSVSVKGKTSEGLDSIGAGLSMSAYAVALLTRMDSNI